MSSSSFMSCPRRSDRGATGWIRKFSAALNIKQAATRKAEQTGLLFLQMLNLFQLFDFSCQPVSSVLRSRIRADWERDPVPFLVPCPNPLCSPLHGAAAVYKQYVGSRGAQIYFKSIWKWEGGTGEEQMSQSGTGRSFFFFLFFFSSVPKKMAIEMLLRCQKVVPYYTLMYAHKHSLTHTQTQSHAPSIVIRGQNMIVMFSTVASLRMSFILFSRRRAPQ